VRFWCVAITWLRGSQQFSKVVGPALGGLVLRPAAEQAAADEPLHLPP
jgi:hypothetical protein